MLRSLALAFALFLHAEAASGQQARLEERVGDTYELRLHHETESASDDGQSSGSSRGSHRLVERVISIGRDGVELEFDSPPDASSEERAADWQFPVRVLKPTDGPLQLLNARELESRIDAWLVAGKIPREACGSWIFTWSAFKIECDPQSVLATLDRFDLRYPDLREGEPFLAPGAREPVPLRIESATAAGVVYVVDAPADGDVFLREHAENDRIVTQIVGDSAPEVEAVMQARAPKEITGTVSMMIETDARGQVVRQIRIIRLKTVAADGSGSGETRTETIERRPIPA